MAKFRYKAAMTILGPMIGWVAYQFSGPWWVYLIALTVFLIGLMSFSIDSEPDGSGYGKRADDSRGHGSGYDGSGGGDC
ncbi:hypothetical protein [Thalassobium sp. R2A62]|uniref:hypothetical protein n=1 Tax=Thalassobium sp. R2A62 TaxID=633131 RepID=UPI001232923F|nr:hypothetical protein [Thalassobium sp. R2A62]